MSAVMGLAVSGLAGERRRAWTVHLRKRFGDREFHGTVDNDAHDAAIGFVSCDEDDGVGEVRIVQLFAGDEYGAGGEAVGWTLGRGDCDDK
jgi:hypothetical protein